MTSTVMLLLSAVLEFLREEISDSDEGRTVVIFVVEISVEIKELSATSLALFVRVKEFKNKSSEARKRFYGG